MTSLAARPVERGFRERSRRAQVSTRLMAAERAHAGQEAAASAAEWRVIGLVVHPDDFNRSLGLASFDIRLEPGSSLPAPGIYAGWLRTTDQILPSTISVGGLDTCADFDRRLEICPSGVTDLDFFGATVSITFVAALWTATSRTFTAI
ncbi:riboflavin kinase [Kribbella sp. CA-294648]|uniref:riboflavin kinase n=1 Tax=Kribbella sp. CA-294648 TaxID=3239948 RepID=UPI003D8AB1DD